MKVPCVYAVRFSAIWGFPFFIIYIFSLLFITLAKLIRAERSEELKVATPGEALRVFEEFLKINYRSISIKKQCEKSGQKCLYEGKLCWPEGCKIAKSFDV